MTDVCHYAQLLVEMESCEIFCLVEAWGLGNIGRSPSQKISSSGSLKNTVGLFAPFLVVVGGIGA
jgi:hypothetical protein